MRLMYIAPKLSKETYEKIGKAIGSFGVTDPREADRIAFIMSGHIKKKPRKKRPKK